MRAAHIMVALVMAVFAAASGTAKLVENPRVVHVMRDVVHVPMHLLPFLAACEIAGAAGVLAGLVWAPLGLLAAGALVLYFVGAVSAHIRVGDYRGLGVPLIPLGLAIACLVTRYLSAYGG